MRVIGAGPTPSLQWEVGSPILPNGVSEHSLAEQGGRAGQDCKVPFPGRTEITPPTGSSFSCAL